MTAHASEKSASNRKTATHAKGEHAVSTHAKSTASHKHTSTNQEEGAAVSVESTESVSPVASSPSTATTAHAAAAPTAATATAATAPTTTAKTAVTSLGAGLLPLPPDVVIPSPPQGYEPTKGTNFRGIVPWTAELVILPKVLQDLARFTSYASVFGSTAPPISQLIEVLTAGGEWSVMRGASAAWDGYCRDQEGSAWRAISNLMDRLRPSFALAVQGDASIATTYPSLAEFLQVKKMSAQKGASARVKNKKAEAAGETGNHGAAGKARERKAAKEALAAQTATQAAAKVAAATPAAAQAQQEAAVPVGVTPAAATQTVKAAQ